MPNDIFSSSHQGATLCWLRGCSDGFARHPVLARLPTPRFRPTAISTKPPCAGTSSLMKASRALVTSRGSHDSVHNSPIPELTCADHSRCESSSMLFVCVPSSLAPAPLSSVSAVVSGCVCVGVLVCCVLLCGFWLVVVVGGGEEGERGVRGREGSGCFKLLVFRETFHQHARKDTLASN